MLKGARVITSDSKSKRWFKGLLFFAIYFLLGKLSIKIHAVVGYHPMIWLPSGVGLGILVVWGESFWPVILAAAVSLGLSGSYPLPAALVVGASSVLEGVIGARLLKRFSNTDRPRLASIREVLVFVFFILGASTLMSSALSVGGLYLLGRLSADKAFLIWKLWWFSNTMGCLTVGSAIIYLFNDIRFRLKSYRLNEYLFLFVLVCVTSLFIYTPLSEFNHTLIIRPYILFPVMIWVTLRFDTLGVVTVNMIVMIMVLIGRVKGVLPTGPGGIEDRMFVHQLITLTLGIMGQVLAAAIREKEEALNAKALEGQLHRARESRFDQVIEAAPNGLLMVDHAGMIVLCNAQIESLFGYRRTELLGKKIETLIPARFRTLHPGHRDGYFAQPETRQMGAGRDLTGLRNDGTEFPVEIGLNPVRTDEGQFVLASIVDITERKMTERTLHEAIVARDDFMSIASHELKTPLTSLSLNIQLARQKIDLEANTAPPLEKIAKIFEVSKKQVDRLAGLVEDLMDASRIRTGKFSLNLEEVHLSQIVTEMTDRLAAEFAKAKISCTTDIDKNVVGKFDALRLEQVIDNLLTNAIKYAPGKPLKVSLKKFGSFAKLVIEDQGRGIPYEKQKRVFERFERATTANNISGLGLGLFIAREIVEGHAGSIRLESVPGEGSRFIVELPLSDHPLNDHAAPANESLSPHNGHGSPNFDLI